MNMIKSLFFVAMSFGLVSSASVVARAEQPVEDEVVADGGLTAESEEALSSQDYNPYDFDDYRRRGGRRACLEFCADEYRDCVRYSPRWRNRGYPRESSYRRNRCEREYNFCARRVCRRGGGRF